MKAIEKVSKSNVMRRAWAIFNQKLSNFKSFSECLERAWKVEKDNLKYKIEKAIQAAQEAMYSQIDWSVPTPFAPSAETMQAYYNSNDYKGD